MLLENAESWKMLKDFGKEDSVLSEASGIEGLLSLVGLNTFIDEIKKMLKESSPLLLQASTLFKDYKEGIGGLYTKLLNSLSANELVKLFDQAGESGVVGVGVDKDGKVNTKITKGITEYSKTLLKKSELTFSELPKSAIKFSAFIATMQRAIFSLLEQSQQNKLDELEEREKAEKVVATHLSEHSYLTQKTGQESVKKSKAVQIERIEENSQEKEGILNKLEKLFAFSSEIFRPVQRGTTEVMSMAIA